MAHTHRMLCWEPLNVLSFALVSGWKIVNEINGRPLHSMECKHCLKLARITIWTHENGNCAPQLHLQHTMDILENCKIIERKIAVQSLVELCGIYCALYFSAICSFCSVLFLLYLSLRFFPHRLIRIMFLCNHTMRSHNCFIRYLWIMNAFSDCSMGAVVFFLSSIFYKYCRWIKHAIFVVYFCFIWSRVREWKRCKRLSKLLLLHALPFQCYFRVFSEWRRAIFWQSRKLTPFRQCDQEFHKLLYGMLVK